MNPVTNAPPCKNREKNNIKHLTKNKTKLNCNKTRVLICNVTVTIIYFNDFHTDYKALKHYMKIFHVGLFLLNLACGQNYHIFRAILTTES